MISKLVKTSKLSSLKSNNYTRYANVLESRLGDVFALRLFVVELDGIVFELTVILSS